jgi:hypothetical protein
MALGALTWRPPCGPWPDASHSSEGARALSAAALTREVGAMGLFFALRRYRADEGGGLPPEPGKPAHCTQRKAAHGRRARLGLQRAPPLLCSAVRALWRRPSPLVALGLRLPSRGMTLCGHWPNATTTTEGAPALSAAALTREVGATRLLAAWCALSTAASRLLLASAVLVSWRTAWPPLEPTTLSSGLGQR